MASYDELMLHLDDIFGNSRTAKLWVNIVIKSAFIMMLYIRAEREGDWPLHLEAVKQMMSYFYASGHVNYARYGLFYFRSMKKLPVEIRGRFMKGEHVMHHISGLWNDLWSDMYMESTFMRYGHIHGVIIGITLQPETLKICALGLHIRSRIVEDMTNMSDQHSVQTQETHKEESKSRMQADAADRKVIREKLEQCINPLAINSETDSQQLVNIFSGRLTPSIVNVDNAVDIGTKQMEVAENTWPVGFYGPISKKVITMDVTRKHVKIGAARIINTTLLFSRIIGLQASSRETIDIQNLLSYELSPVPTSMFSDSGYMRIGKSKAQLKTQLQVKLSTRKASQEIQCMVLHGSAVL